MDFKENGLMYSLGLMIVVFVIAQSLFFLIRAWKRGKEIGLSSASMKNSFIQSSLFSVAPAFSIVATVLALASALGLVLPWIRLSVIGNITYEMTAADSAVGALGIESGLSAPITDPTAFSATVWVMTLGSIFPLFIIPFLLKKMQKSMGSVMSKDKKWADLMAAAAFIGLISAFVGRALVGQGDGTPGSGAGLLSVTALVTASASMLLLEKLSEKRDSKLLKAFSMPVAMYFAMVAVMVLARVLPESIAFFEFR